MVQWIVKISLSVRKYKASPNLKIELDPAKTAFLLVDCDNSSAHTHIVEKEIYTSLEAARRLGFKIIYLYNAINGGVGGPEDVTTKIHGIDYLENSFKLLTPVFHRLIEPLPAEVVIPKSHKDGFNGTVLDYYLKSWSIDTIITVGFHLKSCLYQTCLSARHHNYRVIMLRDCTDSFEFPDTKDANNPEGGWFRYVFIRLYETDIGYTSTSSDLANLAQINS